MQNDMYKAVSWSTFCYLASVIAPVYGHPTFSLTTNAVLSKAHTFKNL